jgi:hypothetical protein
LTFPVYHYHHHHHHYVTTWTAVLGISTEIGHYVCGSYRHDLYSPMILETKAVAAFVAVYLGA